MDHRSSRKYCYASLSHPCIKDAIALHNVSILKLAVLVSEFAQQLAAAHEYFSKEVQTIVSTFRRRSFELQKKRPVESTSTVFSTWEALLSETELDAQAHLDAAGLLIKNVYHPLQGVASHKNRQADMLASFRGNLDSLVQEMTRDLNKAEMDYHQSYKNFAKLSDPASEEGEKVRGHLHQCHNNYIFNIRATNKTVNGYRKALPEILEEMEEIYIDTSNTINVAIESQALLLLTKADEQHRRYEDQMKTCKQVNPYQDITVFVKTTTLNSDLPTLTLQCPRYSFKPAVSLALDDRKNLCTQLIRDRLTERSIHAKKLDLQKNGMDLAILIQQAQDISATLTNVCQRNLASHQYARVYETQLELCRKRNEIRLANLQLSAIKSQIEMLTPKENGYVDDAEGGEAEEEEKGKKNASIKGMWKKAFKSLKSNDKQNWLSKKGSLIKRKDSEEKEEQEEISKEIDPVYSLLKCAADLPKVPKSQKEPQCSGGHSSGSTSKASSPSSSASHSPKTRRKRLSARMKSFSLDTPDPPKQLLGIDEMTKKKSSSFTNNCFGAAGQPGVNHLPVQKKRFGFGTNRSTSLETEEAIKRRSRSSSPQCSPKTKKKEIDVYVSLYHFRGKEKDDMDLRPGSRVNVTNSTDPDWWKGKCSSRSGYFPAKYLLRLQKGQKVYQVTHTMNLTEIDGLGGMRLHKDQIVLCVTEPPENPNVIHVKAANNREAMCPAQFLTEV